MKTSFITVTVTLFFLSTLNSFSIDTVFVNGTDTFKVLPNGYNPTDTNSHVSSMLTEVVDYDTTGVHLKSNNPKFIHKVYKDGSTLIYILRRVGTSSTGVIDVELNNNSIKDFSFGELQLSPYNGLYTDTLSLNGNFNQFVVEVSSDGRVFVDCKVTHNETTSDTLVVITIEKSTSISEGNFNSNVELTLFPNPVVDRLNVRFENISFKPTYQIVDMNGQIVKEDVLRNNSINVSELKTGMYYIKFVSGRGVIQNKFLKR